MPLAPYETGSTWHNLISTPKYASTQKLNTCTTIYETSDIAWLRMPGTRNSTSFLFSILLITWGHDSIYLHISSYTYYYHCPTTSLMSHHNHKLQRWHCTQYITTLAISDRRWKADTLTLIRISFGTGPAYYVSHLLIRWRYSTSRR